MVMATSEIVARGGAGKMPPAGSAKTPWARRRYLPLWGEGDSGPGDVDCARMRALYAPASQARAARKSGMAML
ncbi:MAG: hypothetical protein Devi2KO_03500 [Devosia indica]